MNAVITVAIPIYNGEKYIERAVASVISQPQSDRIQILLIDDGSKDLSGRICDTLAKKHPNVRVIHKENGGVSSARNLAIQNVDTKYISFLDCDDWWEQNFFDANLLEDISKDDSCDVYQFAYQKVNNPMTLKKTCSVENEVYFYSQNGFGRYDWTHPCSFIYRSELLCINNVTYPSAKIGEDVAFVTMALFFARSFKRINKTMFSYWENHVSCLHTTNCLTKVTERHKADCQVQDFFTDMGVGYDAQSNFRWDIANYLPQICAENSFAVTKQFMDINCFKTGSVFQNDTIGEKMKRRLETYARSPRKYWIKQKIILGVPLKVKKLALCIPGIRRVFNYLFNRYYRGFVPM